MRNLIYILHIISATLFFASCEDEGTIMPGDNEPCYTIFVSVPNVSDTRAYYKEDGENIAVVWENGDVVILDDGNQKYSFVFKGMSGNNGEFYHYGDIANAGNWKGTVSFGTAPGSTAQTQKKNNVCGEYLKANVTDVNFINNKPTIPLLPADNKSLIHIQTKSPGMFHGGSLLKIKGLDQNNVYTVTLGNNPEYVFADQGDVLDIYVAVPAGKTISNGTALKFYFYSYDVVTGSAETGDEYHYYMKCNGAITTANNEVVKMTLPNKPTHAAIQLGLSVKWATMNIGATSDQPGEASFGGYYPWGVPEEHYEYAWDADKSSKLMGKELVALNTAFGIKYSSENGFQGIAAKTYQGEVIGDPATSLWGDDWVTPSKKEMEELKGCITEVVGVNWTDWTTNTVPHVKTNGRYVKGKGSYANKKIWLPAAGSVHTQKKGTLDSPASNDGCNGIYMTSTGYLANSFYYLQFGGEGTITVNADASGILTGTYNYNRNHGVNVRPVRK